MQTWITDYDFYKSASNLDTKRLGSQIYEGIHILASLLDVNDKLVNPKRNVKNHPAAKLWIGYEKELLFYIHEHLWFWFGKNYSSIINYENYKILLHVLGWCSAKTLNWITDNLIQTHRSALIQKNPDHYRRIWPDCPTNLKMHYGWRKEK
jgi:hypothetical protein